MEDIILDYNAYKIYIDAGTQYINSLRWDNLAKKILDDIDLSKMKENVYE